MDVSLIADAIDGAGIDASAGTLVNAAIGKQSMWIPATAMYPTNTGGCAAIALTETTAGSGVIAEAAVSAGSTTLNFTPYALGGNAGSATTVFAAITNQSGVTTTFNYSITLLQ